MPGASAPWIDLHAPAQFVFGGAGGPGPARTVFADTGGTQVSPQTAQQTFDDTLHYKLAGTIVLALVTVFVLQQLGFRFVVSAGVGMG